MTDDATHIPRGYETFYCSEAFWGEQGRPPKLVQKLLKGRKERTLVRVFIVLACGARVMVPTQGTEVE